MTIRALPWRKRYLLVGAAGAGLLQPFLALPSLSAERVFANYGPLERDISVEVLETYARTGQLTEELEVYSRYLSPEQLEQLRTGLLIPADLDVVAVSQFLYTPQGEALLKALGGIIQTAGRLNGQKAIRAALILAAADPEEGLTVLNVLKHFPTEGIRLDLGRTAELARAVIAEIEATSRVTAQIRQQAMAEAAGDEEGDSSFSSQIALFSPGPYLWEKRVFDQAVLPTDLYVPDAPRATLIVISHGLGGNRTTLAYLASHLVSHGFAVAVVEHPGSNAEQLDALFAGQAREAVEQEELVGRPVAIQTLLDELETIAQADPALQNRINFQQVGMLGQSLGAYTTLALAGASVDLERLASRCPPAITQLNLSLLLQCLVPSLPLPLPPLQDSRVKAAIAINPLDSAVFGPQGLANIAVPTMIVAGSADTVTPALAEQVRPFTWLQTPERYLLLMEGGTHFSTIFDPQVTEETIPLPEAIIGPKPELAQRYVKVMSLAFFKTHLSGESTYRQYLDASYAQALSQATLPISLIREFTLVN